METPAPVEDTTFLLRWSIAWTIGAGWNLITEMGHIKRKDPRRGEQLYRQHMRSPLRNRSPETFLIARNVALILAYSSAAKLFAFWMATEISNTVAVINLFLE